MGTQMGLEGTLPLEGTLLDLSFVLETAVGFLFVSFLSGTSKVYLESASCVCVLASCCQERAICLMYVLGFVLSSHTVITACFSHQALLVSTGPKALFISSKPTIPFLALPVSNLGSPCDPTGWPLPPHPTDMTFASVPVGHC